MHICYARNRIYKGYFKLMKELFKEDKGGFLRPSCYVCGKRLRVGDYVDGHHPYEAEYSRCKEHKEIK